MTRHCNVIEWVAKTPILLALAEARGARAGAALDLRRAMALSGRNAIRESDAWPR